MIAKTMPPIAKLLARNAVEGLENNLSAKIKSTAEIR
jgi:hypothetical protein